VAGPWRRALRARGSILVAGSTRYDADDEGLLAVLDEWSAPERYAVRVADLRGERRRQSALNENYDLTVRTVHPRAADVVIGESHRDWFRAFARDWVVDRRHVARLKMK
jgi:hypothetical protein